MHLRRCIVGRLLRYQFIETLLLKLLIAFIKSSLDFLLLFSSGYYFFTDRMIKGNYADEYKDGQLLTGFYFVVSV